MAWLDSAAWCTLPPWLQKQFKLRASPKLLVGICAVQMVLLLLALLQALSRTECAVSAWRNDDIVIECSTCQRVSLGLRGFLLHVFGAGVIACGGLAVAWRSQRLLYIYGTAMLLFSMMIGLTAMLAALEIPVLEEAVDEADAACADEARAMVQNARNHANLNAIACLVDTTGAILAIRSKELFGYEEIASAHAEVARASSGL